MVTEPGVRICEQALHQQALGETLHPGGLALTRRALEVCSLPKGAVLLDVACGSGVVVRDLRAHGYSAFGIDLSRALFRRGRRASLIQADAAHIPLAAESLDGILTECSLSVMDGVNRALAEYNRLLRQGGYLMINDLYAHRTEGVEALRALSADTCLRGTLCQSELLEWISRAGFKPVLWEDHSEGLKALNIACLLAGVGERSSAGIGFTALDLQLAVAKARLGYFLLVAEKC